MFLQFIRKIFVTKHTKRQEQHKKDNFNARLQMEEEARSRVEARLTNLEIIADNQLRRRRLRGLE